MMWMLIKKKNFRKIFSNPTNIRTFSKKKIYCNTNDLFKCSVNSMCTTTPLYLRGRHGGRYINNPPCYSYANALYDNKWNANHQTLYRLEEFADSQRGAHGGSFLFRKLLKI